MEIVKVTLPNNEYEILIGDGVVESLSSMKEIFESNAAQTESLLRPVLNPRRIKI